MLDWHKAEAEHRSHLSVFRCTAPESSWFDEEAGVEHHEYPWEYEVQDRISRFRPPLRAPTFVLVGYDEEGLAAVIEMHVTHFDRFCFIAAVAVAHRVSGQGLAVEAIGLARKVLEAYDILSDYTVQARIDPRNYAAQSSFTKAGFEYLHDVDGYEVWGKYVP